MELLQKFDINLPEIVSFVVSKDLASSKTEKKVKAINKFSTYWNLTSSQYPGYVAFPDGNSLFRMLEFLEDEIPSIRLASKSWLSISTTNFRRILDPLLSILCNPQTGVVMTMQEEMFFTDVYDSRQIVNAFSKFRSIVLNSQYELIHYSLANVVTQNIMVKFREVFKYVELTDETYYQVFIQICVKFIVGQLQNEQLSKNSSDTHSVNATACEFLELILKSSKETGVVSMVAHGIIQRILQALSTAIEKQDNAMQVQLLNLIKVILFECNFREENEKCCEILSSELFSDILVNGMNNQVSYVRKHFIEFVVQCVPMITEMLAEEEAVYPVEKMVICLTGILRNVDLSMYGEDSEGTVVSKAPQSSKDQKIRATLLIKKQDQKAFQTNSGDNLVINSELDIQIIIEGIKTIIYHCLHIHPDPSELDFNEEYEYIEGGGFSFKTIFGTSEGHDKLIDKNSKLTPLKEAVLSCMKPFLISSIYCWTDLSIFLPRDYLFSRTGVIAFRHEDQSLINTMIDQTLRNNNGEDDHEDNYEEEKVSGKKGKKRKGKKKKKLVLEPQPSESHDILGTQESYIKSFSNYTHNMLISVLKPIAYHYPNQLIQVILTIWLKKEDILNTNVNLSLIKLIQILTCLDLPLYAVIGALNYNIEKLGFESKKVALKKKVTLEMQECQRESLVFFFLYTYILHNLQFYFRTEDETKIYRLFLKFLKYFQYSRHPTTICWMMETLYIVSQKFSPKEAYLVEKKLKKDYQDLMQILTENVARIISNDLNIGYSEDYCLTFVYPPSMYEHLKAWSVLINQGDASKKVLGPTSFLGTHIHTVKDQSSTYENIHKVSRETVLMNELLEEDQRLIRTDTKDNIVKFIRDLIEAQNFDKDMQMPPYFLEIFFSYYTVQTMKNLFFLLLHNVLLSSSQEKIVYNLDTIVGVIIHILQRKKDNPPVITDIVTELFAGLMKNADKILVKTYRKQISEIFFSDYFFSASSRALNKWKTIIDYYMNHEKNDLIDDIINKWNTSAGMFTSKHYETKQKCTAIKRVAFLLYSSSTDHYLDKIDLLLKKMTENFKMSHLDYKVRIQLLLLCRIILLRLSPDNLVESLRKLWPNLLNELINILETNDTETEDGCALTIEALKLIEVLSLLNLEDFQLNQWIFIMDSYNIKKTSFTKKDMNKVILSTPPEYFQPYVVGLFEDHTQFDYTQEDETHVKDHDAHEPLEEVKGDFNAARTSGSRKYTVLELAHVGSEYAEKFAISQKADVMQTYSATKCIERTQLSTQSAEQMIEKDFIDAAPVKE